jgi:hypothetical protein
VRRLSSSNRAMLRRRGGRFVVHAPAGRASWLKCSGCNQVQGAPAAMALAAMSAL